MTPTPLLSSKTQKMMLENATLLEALNKVPERPDEHSYRGERSPLRKLSPEREQQLASSFAYLSATTDDMLRVTAACVEEDADGAGITIRVASNSGDLSETKEGLESFAASITAAGDTTLSRKDTNLAALRQIVKLDEKRILSRLRSKHAPPSRKVRSKAPLPELLHRSINDPSMPSATTSGDAWIGIRVQLSPIYETFRQLESLPLESDPKEPLQQCLFDLIGQFAAVDTATLQSLLSMPRKLDPTLKTALPRAVGKIARYLKIATDLVNAARDPDSKLLQRIRIETLKPPPLSTVHPQAEYHAALSRITSMKNRGYLVRYPLTSLPTLETGFQRRIGRLADRKVHAEIQLLLYYEQTLPPASRRPRIICSSKSACYMCWHFIQSHGQFHVPSTHGTIYDLWTLPFQLDVTDDARIRLQNAAATLSSRMESKILQTLNQKLRAFPQPNESTLFLREPYESTSTIANVQCSPRMMALQGTANQKRHSAAPSLMIELTHMHDETPVPLEPSLGSSRTEAAEATAPMGAPSAPNRVHQLRDTPITYEFPRADSILTLRNDRTTVYAFHETPFASSQQDHASFGQSSPIYCLRAHTITSSLSAASARSSLPTEENVECVDVRQLPFGHDKEVKLEAGSHGSEKVLALVNGRRTVMLKFVPVKEDAR